MLKLFLFQKYKTKSTSCNLNEKCHTRNAASQHSCLPVRVLLPRNFTFFSHILDCLEVKAGFVENHKPIKISLRKRNNLYMCASHLYF